MNSPYTFSSKANLISGMDPEKLQSELDRLRAILLATIDYSAQKETINTKPEQVDYANNYHRLWKEQVEKQFEEKGLGKLEKSLQHLTVVYRVNADLEYVNFIKEITGYHLDLFGNIEERVKKILQKGNIANTKEHIDIAAMIQLYRRSGKGQENAHVLHNLSMAYHAILYEKKKRKGDIFPIIKHLKEINLTSPRKTEAL